VLTGGGRLAGIDVADDDNVDVKLLLTDVVVSMLIVIADRDVVCNLMLQ